VVLVNILLPRVPLRPISANLRDAEPTMGHDVGEPCLLGSEECKAGKHCLLCADGTRFRMIRQDAGRGALPRDRRRTSAHGEQGHLTGMHRARIGYGGEFTWP
jgi:hypothetical protein